MPCPPRPRIAGAIAAFAAVTGIALIPGSSAGDLASRYSAGQQRANQLKAQISAESQRIDGFEGTIGTLQGRLTAIERSLATQEQELANVRARLTAARDRLTLLERDYARDRQILAAELVARYESPPPTIVDVVVEANGFDNLLNRLRNLKTIERENAEATQAVRDTRAAVAAQTQRLAAEQARRTRATAAVSVERDQVAQLKLSIVNRELLFARTRARNRSELVALRDKLSREATILQQRAVAAQRAAFATGGAPVAGCVNTPFVPHGGSTGFFPAPGTDYSVGEEPVLAARLDALGRALGLDLIGISGYRTPQHSVAVGGFADDPHTQGIASDTPGVEGVPESTLQRFCLTRPFGGAREADHIQES
jgi:peptidoglycan hydrolase CwlO-like protein